MVESEVIQKARGERMQLARYISSKMHHNAQLKGDHVVAFVYGQEEPHQRAQRIQYIAYGDTPFQTLGVFPDAEGITDSSYEWKPEMKKVVVDRLDAFSLAFADPRLLRVPIMATSNLWAEVAMFSSADEKKWYDVDDRILRAQSHVREIHILTPKILSGADRARDYAGTLEYPFSMLDVRSLVVAYMEANFDNDELFFVECGSIAHDSDFQVQDFRYKYQVAMSGMCPRCAELEVDFSAAIPSVK